MREEAAFTAHYRASDMEKKKKKKTLQLTSITR